MVQMMKQEVRKLQSRHPDGTTMYPGAYVFTWIRVGATWHLAGIEEYTP